MFVCLPAALDVVVGGVVVVAVVVSPHGINGSARLSGCKCA